MNSLFSADKLRADFYERVARIMDDTIKNAGKRVAENATNVRHLPKHVHLSS